MRGKCALVFSFDDDDDVAAKFRGGRVDEREEDRGGGVVVDDETANEEAGFKSTDDTGSFRFDRRRGVERRRGRGGTREGIRRYWGGGRAIR